MSDHQNRDDLAMKWMDETTVRYVEIIHHEHGADTKSIFASKRLNRFPVLFLLVMIIASYRLQMLMLSWSVGTFLSLFWAWLSVLFTLFELLVVNIICLVLKRETFEFREKLIMQLRVYAEPIQAEIA